MIIIYTVLGVKLVSYDKEIKLEITSITGDYIVISIIGPARVGKSTLINQLCGATIATTSNTLESCTQNIDAYRCGRYLFLDFKGDDLGDLNKNLKLSLYAASISQVVVYYSLNKISEHSMQTIYYLKKTAAPVMVMALRTNLRTTNSIISKYQSIFNEIIIFNDSVDVLDKFRNIFNVLPMRAGTLIFKTLVENIDLVNNNEIKLYSLIEIEDKCENNIKKMKSHKYIYGFEKCNIEKYDDIIRKAECKYLYNICTADICNICDIEEYNNKIFRKFQLLKEEQKNNADNNIKILGVVVGIFALLSDYRFKEDIIYTGRYTAPFCWRWRFGGYMCGHIIGKCYYLNYEYEYTNYIEFLGVYFRVN